jgi:ADP-ribosyl-[dinitrogen reductase] hydrolase
VGHKDTQRAVALARAQSAVTHAAEECLDAAEVLARVLAAAIDGECIKSLSGAERAGLASSSARAIAKGAWRGKARARIRSSGYVIDTLEAALWAVGSSDNFSEAVLKAVNLGDDADTVGAVTAQIAGAIWGYSAIPERWTARLAWKDRLVETATALWTLSAMS